MNREQRQALIRSDRMVKLESLTQVEKYRIQHLNPSHADDDDDETVIIQLETSEGDYIYTSWPKCPFYPDDVSRINNRVLLCTITYMTISEPRVTNIFYISLCITNTRIFTNSNVIFIHSNLRNVHSL